MPENFVQVFMKRTLRDAHGLPVPGLRPVSEPLMAFPGDLMKPGIQGGAEIALSVLEDGSVADARIVTATHEQYGVAAREVIATWKFGPLAESTIAAPVEVRCHLTFKTR
jgi:TonB family protein